MTAKRAPKQKYEFHLRRHGDTVNCATKKDRDYLVSAFANWKRNRPGSLALKSRKDGEGYIAEFTGISPAEATEARLAGGEGDI